MKNKNNVMGAIITPSDARVEIIPIPAVEISMERYSELIAKEERLKLLENAVKTQSDFACLAEIKKIFGLEERKGKQNE